MGAEGLYLAVFFSEGPWIFLQATSEVRAPPSLSDLISITIENDNGNLLVFLLGMDDILRLDKLVQQKLRRLADAVNIVPHEGERHRANCVLAAYSHETSSNGNRCRVSGKFCYPAARAQSGHAGTDETC